MAIGAVGSGVMSSTLAALGTVVGAAVLFVRAEWPEAARARMLAASAGIMLGATAFSLVGPSLATLTTRHGDVVGALLCAATVVLGAVAVGAFNDVVPHEHLTKGIEGPATERLGRHTLFVLAITLHNVPEGLSVGVAGGADWRAGVPVVLGIFVQNLPEGFAVAAAMLASGVGRSRAVAVGAATAVAEIAGGLVGALAAAAGEVVVPYGLAFAGGAMLFVVSGEVIPETHRDGHENAATYALVLGFAAMMCIDHLLG